MSNCSTGCKTKDHESFGACMRSKRSGVMGLETTGSQVGRNFEKQYNKDLDFYANAVKQGIQPEGTSRQQVQDALILSDTTGKAFDAGA